MLRLPGVWLAALWVGVMIHLDWHLGRPYHDHRSFDFAYHWLLAIPTFAPIAWFAHRRWPGSPLKAALVMTFLGVLLGQGVEPLSEVILDGAGAEPFTNPIRLRIFAEFMIGGVVVLLLGTALLARSRRARSG
jgi:hypothetical protein